MKLLKKVILTIYMFVNNNLPFIENVVCFFTNVIKFRKLLWKDRDWDYRGTMLAFEIKCRAQAKYFQKYGRETELNSRYKFECIECACALRRLREGNFELDVTDKYYEIEFEKQQAFYTKVVQDSIPKMFRWWD
jgi:hypothetical protein